MVELQRSIVGSAEGVHSLTLYRTFGYLCGNIINANYASSCEGA